jgi:hypothetical protein
LPGPALASGGWSLEQRHQLVLNPVVEITREALALLGGRGESLPLQPLRHAPRIGVIRRLV